MRDLIVHGLVSPLDPKITSNIYEKVAQPMFGFGDHEMERDTITTHRLGAANIENGERGPYIRLSPTVAIPAALKESIIGYIATATSVKNQNLVSGTRFRRGGSVGLVTSGFESLNVEVHGADRDEVVALVFAIVEGNATAFTQDADAPVTVTPVDGAKSIPGIPAGDEHPADAVRNMCR
jgi:hypothetical protein